MRRVAYSLLIWLTFALASFAQSTTVSGTITDANSQPFAGGTYQIQFNTNGTVGPYQWNGSAFTPQTYRGALNGSGAFSGVSVPSNDYISGSTPGTTEWFFTMCPASTSECTTVTLKVTGSTLSVSSLIVPPAISVQATPNNQPAAYSDAEISGATLGFTYFNLTSSLLRVCTISLPCTWANVGSSGSGTVNSGTQGEPAIYPATGTAVSSNPAYLNCAAFSGADDSLKIQACLTALQALNAQSGVADARGMTGGVWSVNPFVGGSNVPTSGTLLLPPGLITTSVPIVSTEDWVMVGTAANANTGVNFGIGGRATGTVLQASSSFPTTYTTGTVTVGTDGFHDIIIGSGTGWTTSNIAVGCAFVSPAGGLTHETYGIITSINSTTSITLGWGVTPTGTKPPSGSTYDIFCPVYSAGDGANASDVGFEYGYGLENVALDANERAGVVPYINWFGGQFTYARNVAFYNYCGMGFDLEGRYAQNSGPYGPMASYPGTCGVAGTLPFHIAETGGGPMGFSGISFNKGISSTTPSVGMALDGDGITVSHIDSEAVGIGVDIGDNIACIPACAYPGEGWTGPPRGFDVFEVHGGAGSLVTMVKLGNNNGGPTATSVREVTPGTVVTNLVIDTANSCTMTQSSDHSLAQYILGATGKITASSSSIAACQPSLIPAGGVLSGTYPNPGLATTVGVTGQGASPVMGYYFSSNCPSTDTGNCWQTPANTNIDGTCNSTNLNATITCTDAVFAAGDVGKQIMYYAGGCAAYSSGVSGNTNNFTGGTTVVTITTFNSATSITASTTADATVTNNKGCVVWGTPDDTAAATFSTAVLNAPQCPRVFLAAANYLLSKPPAFLYQQPNSCTQIPSLVNGSTTLGNLLYSAGYEVEGRGVGPTTLYLTNNFPNGDACNHGPSGTGCFVRTLEGRWVDFSISGGGEYNAPALSAGTTLIYLWGPGSTENFTCTNYAGNHGNGEDATIGIAVSNWEQLQQVNNSGCGDVALDVLSGTYVTAFRVSLENSAQAELEVTGPGSGGNISEFNCFSCNLYAAQMHISGGGQTQIIYNGGGSIHFYGGVITDGASGISNAIVGYDGGSAGSIFTAEGTVFNLTSNTNSNESSIVCSAACTNYLRNATLTARGSGKTYVDGSSSSILYDQGGNSLGPSTVTISGSIFGASALAGLVGNLPACSATLFGQTATVSDANVTTFAATLTGSGSHKSLGYCNSSNWTLAAQ